MEVYEYDLVALLIFVIGIYVMAKSELEVTLSAGPTDGRGMVNDNSKYTKSKKLHLGNIQTKLLGFVLIVISSVIYVNVKGELLFVI
jgi:hypothetical protein